MSEQNDPTLDALRTLLDEKLAPVLADIETIKAERATPNPEPAPVAAAPVAAAPSMDERMAALEAKAEAAIARAQAAEKALARRPMRRGRSVMPAFEGPAARNGYEGLTMDCRTSAPTMAVVVERCIPALTEADGAKQVTRAQLNANLSAILMAAEADGIITDPNHRATWA